MQWKASLHHIDISPREMALRRGATPLAIVVALCLIAATRTEAQLRVGFYSRICPKPELIVKQEVEKAVKYYSITYLSSSWLLYNPVI